MGGGAGIATGAFDRETGALGPPLDWEQVGSFDAHRGAMTADGKFALVMHFTVGQGWTYETFRLFEDGTIESTGHLLTGVPEVVNLEFILPRPLAGDANRDGRVDAADVVAVVRDVTGEQPLYHWISRENADLDGDADVDTGDLEALIVLLNGEAP